MAACNQPDLGDDLLEHGLRRPNSVGRAVMKRLTGVGSKQLADGRDAID
jgi:hypothetical protein